MEVPRGAHCKGNVGGEAGREHFWFLPGAEMRAGICAPKQHLMWECSPAKCHATGYSIRH